jgi:hypothetical protein
MKRNTALYSAKTKPILPQLAVCRSRHPGNVSRASRPRFEGGTPPTRQGQDALARKRLTASLRTGRVCRTKPICRRPESKLTTAVERGYGRESESRLRENKANSPRKCQVGSLKCQVEGVRGRPLRLHTSQETPDGVTTNRASVQNKANLLKGEITVTSCRKRSYDKERRMATLQKQSQFPPVRLPAGFRRGRALPRCLADGYNPGREFFALRALIWGAGVHIFTNAEFSAPVPRAT